MSEKKQVPIKVEDQIQNDSGNELIEKEKEEWLKVYYSKIQLEHDYSLRKKDALTNWSLTILVALLGIYFGIQGGLIQDLVIDQSLRFILVTGFIIILGQFFSNSLIAYAYLRKFRYIMEQIDSHWMTGKPSLKTILEKISTFDHKSKTVVGVKKMISAQLRAGFAIILGGPIIIWISELFNIENISYNHIIAFIILGGFVIWEIVSLNTYDKLKQSPTS